MEAVLSLLREKYSSERDIAPKLRPADILLVHTKNSLWSKLIRTATHCYWNHALLVYSAADLECGKDSPLVVDAKTNGIVALGKAGYYLDNPAKFDVAVKRFERDWFQAGIGHDLCISGRVCNLAANEAEFKLGSRAGDAADQLLRQATLILRFVRRKLFGSRPPPRLPWNLRLSEFKAFTCGGFVQWCYYRAVSRAIDDTGMENTRLREVLFNSRISGDVTPFGLLTTTPADLANCQKLTWKYILKDGRLSDYSQQAAAT